MYRTHSEFIMAYVLRELSTASAKAHASEVMKRPQLATASQVFLMDDSESRFFLAAVVIDSQVEQIVMADRGFPPEIEHDGPSDWQLVNLQKLLTRKGIRLAKSYTMKEKV